MICSGCAECRNTGFMGRIGFFELIRVNTELRTAIAENRPVIELKENMGKDFINMRSDGIFKAAAGATTIQEVLRATQDVEELIK